MNQPRRTGATDIQAEIKSTRQAPGLFDYLLILLMALSVLAVCIGRAPYLHDFAEWLYQGQIVRQFLVEPAAVSSFTLAGYPVPNSLVTMLLAGLSFVFPPVWAGKILLASMLLAWYVVIRLFCARFAEVPWRGAAALVLYASTALATFFWYGLVSYQLALLLFTWFVAVYRLQTGAWVIAFFGLAIFFSHAIVFLVFGLFLGVRLLHKWDKNVVAGLLPATACSLWFLVGRHYEGFVPQRIDAVWSGLLEAIVYKAGYPAMLGPFKNFVWPDGRSLLENLGWVYWPGFLVNFLVAAAFGLLVVRVTWNYFHANSAESTEDTVLRRAWAVTMLLLMLFYLLSPYHFFGLVNAGGRVLLPLILMAFMLGWKLAGPFVRAAVWPIALFAFITCGSYLYLMLQTRQAAFDAVAHSSVQMQPTDSVLEYNAKLNASSRYRYFNYRVFNFARRFDQIETGKYRGLALRNGMVIRFETENH